MSKAAKKDDGSAEISEYGDYDDEIDEDIQPQGTKGAKDKNGDDVMKKIKQLAEDSDFDDKLLESSEEEPPPAKAPSPPAKIKDVVPDSTERDIMYSPVSDKIEFEEVEKKDSARDRAKDKVK